MANAITPNNYNNNNNTNYLVNKCLLSVKNRDSIAEA